MAARGRSVRALTGGDGEENSSTRKKKEDVLNQARAVLRQSQQFRPSNKADSKKNNNLSSRLAFTQQPQEDFWTPGGVVVDTTSLHQQQRYDGQRPRGNKLQQQDDFGLPFRDAMRKSPVAGFKSVQKLEGDGHSQASSSSTTISMNTADLKGSSDGETSDSESSVGSISSQRRAKPLKHKEPFPMKLTPLAPAPTAVTPEIDPKTKLEQLQPPLSAIDSDVEGGRTAAPSEIAPPPTGGKSAPVLGLEEEDEQGFSRALIKKSEEDPHWFEKALLVRGESISEAAYKAFKQVQAEQDAEKRVKMGFGRVRRPIFANMTDPEYTADWISDHVGDQLSDGEVEDIADMPESEYVDDVPHPEEILDELDNDFTENVLEELDDRGTDGDVDTASIIKTASELEASGVLDEIASNLHSVLEISAKVDPFEADLSRMSGEEKTFAREFDDAMEDESEPLKSIFNDIFQNPEEIKPPVKELQEAKGEVDVDLVDSTNNNKSVSQSITRIVQTHQRLESAGNTWIQYDGEEESYQDTFIQGSTSKSSATKSTTKKTSSSNRVKSKPSKEAPPKKSSSSSTLKDKSESGTSKAHSISIPEKQPSAAHTQSKSKSKSKSKPTTLPPAVESKSSKSSSTPVPSLTHSSKKSPSLHDREPHPSSRYQKNIQAILEKEVYQKELKRRRSQKLREERSQDRLKLVGKESLERNKRSSWVDTSYTEILLPELFKYKSVSGLEAAKAKRATGMASPLEPANFGAPYFSFNGALTSSDQFGSAGLLGAAQVESLDIPDLVREVLASNERMYKMTVEAGRQMAKVYKNKVRLRTATATTRNK